MSNDNSHPYRKALLCTSAIIATPFVLILLMAALLYVPPVQRWAVSQAADYASAETGMQVSVGYVRLSFPLDLRLDSVRVVKQNDSLPQLKDTLLNARQLVADVAFWPLLKGQVEIDELDFQGVQVNTDGLIAAARVKGGVGRLRLQSHGIDLGQAFANIDQAAISEAQLDVALSDSVPEDTTESQNLWKIKAQRLSLKNSRVVVHMPGDTLQVAFSLKQLTAEDGLFDLGKPSYTLRRLTLEGGTLNFDNRFEPHLKGLDANHLALTSLAVAIDSFSYDGNRLQLALSHCAAKEQSGIEVSQISGRVDMDSTRLLLPTLTVRTPESSLQAQVAMDLNAFDDRHPGQLNVSIDGALGKQDLVRFMGDMPQAFRRQWPNQPLTVKGSVRGNMQQATISSLVVKLPTAFNLTAHGTAANLSEVSRLKADIRLQANTYNLGFLTTLLDADTRRMVRIPSGIGLSSHIKADGTAYSATFRATQGGGSLSGQAKANTQGMVYSAQLSATAFPLQHFLPGYGLSPLTASLTAQGAGTDFLSSSTKLSAKANVGRLTCSGYNLADMDFTAQVASGRAEATLDSRNPLLCGRIDLGALLSKKKLQATLICDLAKADLYRLGIVKNPLTASLCGHIDVASNLRDNHRIDGIIGDLTLRDSARTYRPESITLDAFTRPDSTHANICSGDFLMKLDASGYYDKLLACGTKIMEEAGRQHQSRTIDQKRLRALLPTLCLQFNTGHENFISRALRRFGYEFSSASADFDTSPQEGINGELKLDSLVAAGFQIDTIRFGLRSDSVNTFFNAQVRNNKKNPQYVFDARFGGTFYEKGLYLGTRIFDADEKLGVGFGLAASMVDEGISISLGDKRKPVLGYKEFSVNSGNYLLLGRDQRVSADLRLKADDGMSVFVYSNDSTEALQDLTVSLGKFDLEKVLSLIPYVPHMSGILDGDFHVIHTANELSVSSAVSIENMYYEKCPMGNIASEFVYIPKEDGTQFVDGTLSCNSHEVGALRGSYNPAGEGSIDASLKLAQTPLQLLNGFIPDQLFGFKGYADGTLTLQGALDQLDVNGELLLDSASMFSTPYGVALRFADDPVYIKQSHLTLDQFKMYANNDSPLSVSGYVDFSDMERMYTELRMRATNFQLIDAKENRRSETFGKAFVNFFGLIKGPVESLQMRGKLDVLGSTDMTYILRDSPLTTDNTMDDLVQFVNFRDTTTTPITRPPLNGLDMDLTMNIDEGAHILCALNTDKSNYVDLIGGGELRMKYNTTDNLRLTGRYTLSNGEMKYSLPVIPLKTFTIQDGSYVEFTGDPMNPRLNITATEQTKANVSSGTSGSEKTVLFECGVVITKTLNDMGLQFIIDAPEDMTVHNELQTMSEESRGKIAVTMLTTGMYLTSGNTSSFSMNSALTAFLNSQISTISAGALRTLDLSFGMDNTTTGTGTTRTDYSFKFAKRFWNNRLRIVIGGKVSSGSDAANENDTFFDNVTFEYRMSQTSNQYLKLFYNRDSYDWLDGYVEEFGGGFIWRKKLQSLKDLFRFRSDKQSAPAAKADSLKTEKQ